MIVRDEERFLGDALASIAGVADEICVVDTGSRDRTLELARDAGAKIKEIDWQHDFSKARNAALEMATRRWIFVLDADERLSPESRDMLRALADLPAHLTGLWVRCFNFAEDYKGTGAISNAIVRVFPNHARIRYRNRIHEMIALDDSEDGVPALRSPIEIIHFGYAQDVMRERKKGERNLALAKAALDDAPDDPFHWYNYASSAMLADETAAATMALERMRELSNARTKQRGDGRVQSFVPNGLIRLATLYLLRGETNRAEELAREVLRAAPTLADAHFMLGKALVPQHRFAEAREAFIASIEDGNYVEQHPTVDNEVPLWKAHSEIGATFMQQGGYDLAVAWFDFALKARPKIQPVRLNRARALEALERFDEAREAFAAVWADDRDFLAANEYVNFLLRRGEDGAAVAFVEEAAPELSGEPQLIFYGSAAAIAFRNGMPAMERYVDLALAAQVPEAHARLEALLAHLRAAGALEASAAKTPS